MVIVQITPITTPFAITNPISFPKAKSITHSAKKPATVVKALPTTDSMVASIALAMASTLFSLLSLSSSYL